MGHKIINDEVVAKMILGVGIALIEVALIVAAVIALITGGPLL